MSRKGLRLSNLWFIGEDGGEGPQSVFSAMMKEFNNMREKEKVIMLSVIGVAV